MTRRSWRDRAACRGWDTHRFYVGKDAAQPPVDILELCLSCPVRPRCLNEAMQNYEYGIWGGTTEKQRRQLRRNYQRKTCPSCAGDVFTLPNGVQVCPWCGLSWSAVKVRTRTGVQQVTQTAGGA